jgi:DNA-binding HxlR family transcriptional regulator
MAALDLLGRRWALRIIWELRDGPLGFRELQQHCDGMSSSVLRDRLFELSQAAIVATDESGRYSLSPLGQELLEALRPVSEWSGRWARELTGG